jgi:putative addiction module component (TIGR02574 family)
MGKLALDVEKLTHDEQLDLLEKVWEQLSATRDALPLTAAQRAELDRRLDDLERDGPVGIPWDEVARRIQNRVPRSRSSSAQPRRRMWTMRMLGTSDKAAVLAIGFLPPSAYDE